MATQPKARKIKRIGLAIEMEDGGRIMIYADDLHHAEVIVTTEPVPYHEWQYDQRRIPIGVPQTSILIEGLESYRITETMPATADHVLSTLKAIE